MFYLYSVLTNINSLTPSKYTLFAVPSLVEWKIEKALTWKEREENKRKFNEFVLLLLNAINKIKVLKNH